MLAREHTLTGQKNFDKVKKDGKVYQCKDFAVAVINTSKEDLSRFGFVISTKMSKLAVQRNRIKRAMSEAVRYNLKDVAKGYDVIFLVKKSIMNKSTEEIMRQVKEFLLQTKF
jgi:ribonuclease P protein component